MKEIKTKPASTKPKALDKMSRIPRDTKTALLKARDKFKEIEVQEVNATPENYATDHIIQGVANAVHKSIGNLRRHTWQLIRKGKQARQTRDAEFNEQSEKESFRFSGR